MVKDNVVLRKNPDMITRVIDDQVILVPIYKTSDEINCIYTLNNVGSTLWELINGKRSVAAIKKQVLKDFDTTAKEVDKEMGKFLKELKEIKAVK
ncbi:MAG: PqqD family protein [Candidatus Omnitrophica bacterium]|nr:PqqD family protein [Candidatus Omnitrophota bacterium]